MVVSSGQMYHKACKRKSFCPEKWAERRKNVIFECQKWLVILKKSIFAAATYKFLCAEKTCGTTFAVRKKKLSDYRTQPPAWGTKILHYGYTETNREYKILPKTLSGNGQWQHVPTPFSRTTAPAKASAGSSLLEFVPTLYVNFCKRKRTEGTYKR